MPRKKSNHPSVVKPEAEEENDDTILIGKDLSRNSSSSTSRKGGNRSKRKILEPDNENNDDEEDADNVRRHDESLSQLTMKFSSQIPDMTQDIGEVKEFERNNLRKLSSVQREKAILDLTRFVLFKALAGEAIDRTKCIKEIGINDARISSAVFDEVNIRLRNMFDFELIRQPEWMNKMKGLNTNRYTKDRYYLVNALHDQEDDNHSRLLHCIHGTTSIEKGLLILTLAFAYCKGEPRNDGSRWILDKHLFQLLNRVDENIPAEPPVHGAAKKNRNNTSLSQSSRRLSSSSDRDMDVGGVSLSPDVDSALEIFCKRDYLLKEKATEEQINNGGPDVDETSNFYAMGPRAAVEIGRKQIIHFCAEILDEEPDPTMLSELDDDRADDEEEPEMVEGN